MLKYGMLFGSILFPLLAVRMRTDPPAQPKGQPAPLLTLRAGTLPVWVVRHSPDGTRLAIICAGAASTLWDATTGKLLLTVSGDSVPFLRGLTFHPKGGHLVTGGRKGAVSLWDARTGQEKPLLRDERYPVFDLALDREALLLAVGGVAREADSGLKVWDATTARRKDGFIERGRIIGRVVFNPDGKRLASADVEGRVVVWDVPTGKAAFTLSPGEGGVIDLAWSPDGRRLAVAHERGTVTVWEMGAGKAAQRLRGQLPSGGAVAFLPDGKRLLACLYDLPVFGREPPRGEVCVWDITTGEGRVVLRSQGKEGVINRLSVSPDGVRLATGHGDGTVKVWSMKDLLGK